MAKDSKVPSEHHNDYPRTYGTKEGKKTPIDLETIYSTLHNGYTPKGLADMFSTNEPNIDFLA